MKIRTSELSGIALDWVVAECEGLEKILFRGCVVVPKTWSNGGTYPIKFQPSTNWSQGGPIIEREQINITTLHTYKFQWQAYLDTPNSHMLNSTPLIAAMRCYVQLKLGDEIDVPNEFISK